MTVTLSGWNRGLLTISLIKLVREYSGQDLPTVKAAVEGLVDGKPFTIQFDNAGRAADFVAKAEHLGARISN